MVQDQYAKIVRFSVRQDIFSKLLRAPVWQGKERKFWRLFVISNDEEFCSFPVVKSGSHRGEGPGPGGSSHSYPLYSYFAA